MFLGYRTAPGGKFGGQYVVADLDDFVGCDLDVHAYHTIFRFWPHHTEQVFLPDVGVVFPLKKKYDHANSTLEGRESSAWERDKHSPDYTLVNHVLIDGSTLYIRP